MRTFQFNISSSRNVSFRYTETFTLDDMGLDEEEWSEMTEEEQEQAIDDYAMQLLFDHYVSYCAEEIKEQCN